MTDKEKDLEMINELSEKIIRFVAEESLKKDYTPEIVVNVFGMIFCNSCELLMGKDKIRAFFKEVLETIYPENHD